LIKLNFAMNMKGIDPTRAEISHASEETIIA
jgi:hypothetical protein